MSEQTSPKPRESVFTTSPTGSTNPSSSSSRSAASPPTVVMSCTPSPKNRQNFTAATSINNGDGDDVITMLSTAGNSSTTSPASELLHEEDDDLSLPSSFALPSPVSSNPPTRRGSLNLPPTRSSSLKLLKAPTPRHSYQQRKQQGEHIDHHVSFDLPLPVAEDPHHRDEDDRDVPLPPSKQQQNDAAAPYTDDEKEQQQQDVDWVDHYARRWNEKAWFPRFMGTDIPTFARFIFLHSLILTSITPLVRAVTGVWKAEVPTVWLLNMAYKLVVAISTATASFSASTTHAGDNFTIVAPNATAAFTSLIASPLAAASSAHLVKGGSLTYRVENNVTFNAKNAPELDHTWVMHATCGMMWLIVSYVQIAIIPKYGSKSLHRRTGPVALIVLFLHLGAALNTLINDHQKHQTLNKVALSTMTFYVAAYAIVGTQKAFAYLMFHKDGKTSPAEVAALLKEHVNQMMIGWIWSLSGAGPIRFVGSFLEPMGFGPLRCQDRHGSLCPVECMWPYFNRMLWIASWNLLMCGCYCKIMGQHELTKAWIRNMNHHMKLCGFFFVLNMIPGSAEFVSMILGGSANPASSIITYALWVAQAMQFAAFFPTSTKSFSSSPPSSPMGKKKLKQSLSSLK